MLMTWLISLVGLGHVLDAMSPSSRDDILQAANIRQSLGCHSLGMKVPVHCPKPVGSLRFTNICVVHISHSPNGHCALTERQNSSKLDPFLSRYRTSWRARQRSHFRGRFYTLSCTNHKTPSKGTVVLPHHCPSREYSQGTCCPAPMRHQPGLLTSYT